MGLSPRVRGTRRMRSLKSSSSGLSPRVRGNPAEVAVDFVDVGSIPACAGEPGFLLLVRVVVEVYPRVCGGTSSSTWFVRPDAGLSPRVRGNLANYSTIILLDRSIPACAGEPCISLNLSASTTVYPRVCGGTALVADLLLCAAGLSPRVRGNPIAVSRIWPRRGSIPACAGEPEVCAALPCCHAVYPRVCGGTVCAANVTPCNAGLSPRVRGNLNSTSP